MSPTFEWIRDPAAFQALEPTWRDLCARILCARTGGVVVFQEFGWQWRAWVHVASRQGHELRILVGRAAGRVVLIWPLVLDRGTLRFLSCAQTEYRDVLVEPGPATDDWLDAALAKVSTLPEARRVVLYDVRCDSQLARLMARRSPRGFRVDRKTFLIRLEHRQSWNAYAQHLPNRLQSDQRRQWRRVSAMPGDIRFRIVTDRAEVLDAVDWFFHHKLLWLQERRTVAHSFESAGYQSFIKATVAAMHDQGRLVLGKLGSTQQTLSVGFGFASDGVFTFHSYAYNAEFQSVSPSRLLLEQLIRWSLDNGIQEFDFLPWDIQYKARWANDTLAIHDYVMPRSLLERLKCELQVLDLGRFVDDRWLARQYRRLPARWRNALRETIVADWDFGGAVQRLGAGKQARGSAPVPARGQAPGPL
jgi:CelD/BcsL family acetyltransferase involved in cellulose biosynthesis